MGLIAACHAVDDIYQGPVPALLPSFIAGRHYSYAEGAGCSADAAEADQAAVPGAEAAAHLAAG